VLDPAATPLLERRMRLARNLEERLSVLMTLADDRAVAATYIMGDPPREELRPAILTGGLRQLPALAASGRVSMCRLPVTGLSHSCIRV
jgi:hypothetical protein